MYSRWKLRAKGKDGTSEGAKEASGEGKVNGAATDTAIGWRFPHPPRRMYARCGPVEDPPTLCVERVDRTPHGTLSTCWLAGST